MFILLSISFIKVTTSIRITYRNCLNIVCNIYGVCSIQMHDGSKKKIRARSIKNIEDSYDSLSQLSDTLLYYFLSNSIAFGVQKRILWMAGPAYFY